ncbi:MAG TPA: serine/threonine-protein kinase, partial [Polyangiaceae bacterium]
MSLAPGDRIGERYRIVRPLGQGGMADVFLVEEEPTGELRTLKQLRLDGPELLDAFRSEFALLAEVTHPRLTRVYDFGSWRVRGDLFHYYTSEWIDGRTLADCVAEPPAAFMPALTDAIEGLSALHDIGMRHGDFTPDNVLVGENGRGVLIDLGCARAFGGGATTVAGTPMFMAPELTRDGGGDARADLYSVGATIRWMYDQTHAPLGGALAKVTARLLVPEPRLRPVSVREVLEELGVRPSAGSGIRAAAPRLYGRDRERALISQFLDRVRSRSAGPRVAELAGPSGSGKSRLLRDLVARAEIEQSVLRSHAAERAPVRWLLSTATGVRELGTGAREGLAAAQALVDRSEPLLLALEDVDRLEPAEAESLLSFARSLDAQGMTALLVCGAMEWPGVAVEKIELAPLDRAALRQWTGESLSEGSEKTILAASGGWPAAIERELERLEWSRHEKRAPVLREAKRRSDGASLLDALPTRERASLALLVALGGELDG